MNFIFRRIIFIYVHPFMFLLASSARLQLGSVGTSRHRLSRVARRPYCWILDWTFSFDRRFDDCCTSVCALELLPPYCWIFDWAFELERLDWCECCWTEVCALELSFPNCWTPDWTLEFDRRFNACWTSDCELELLLPYCWTCDCSLEFAGLAVAPPDNYLKDWTIHFLKWFSLTYLWQCRWKIFRKLSLRCWNQIWPIRNNLKLKLSYIL